MKTFNDALRRLRRLLPSERLLIDPAHLAAYESDGLTAFAVTPRAVVVAETPEEVIETVRICNDNIIPFVARGSGTSLSGGSLPHADGSVIATFDSLYVMTRQNGRWGIRGRSSFAP